MRIKSLLEKLKDKTVQELNSIAKRYGLTGYSKFDKKDLVKFVRRKLKALASAKSNARSKTKKKRKKRAGEDGMVLLPRDSEWLYVFWNLTVQQEALLKSSGVPTLRLLGHPDRRELKRIPLSQGTRCWHIQAGTTNRDYIAELGVVDWRGVFRPLLASNPASTPPAEVSGNFQAVFGEFKPDKTPQPHPGPPGADSEKAERVGKLSYSKESGTDYASASSQDVLRRK